MLYGLGLLPPAGYTSLQKSVFFGLAKPHQKNFAGSTPVARVDSNVKARCAREQVMDMSLELFAMEKRRATERKRQRAMHL